MRSSSIARRYAKALFEIGVEGKSTDALGKALRRILGVFEGNPDLYKVLLNPMYKVEERKALVSNIIKEEGSLPAAEKFIELLVEQRKIRLLPDIAAAYSKFEDDLAGRLRVTVESPVELDAKLLDEIKAKLGASTGKNVILTFQRNPELLGGLVIRMDNTILDGSLKTQLALMKEKILEGVV